MLIRNIKKLELIGGSADFGCCGGDNVGCGIRMVIVRAATLVMVLVFLEMVAVVM